MRHQASVRHSFSLSTDDLAPQGRLSDIGFMLRECLLMAGHAPAEQLYASAASSSFKPLAS